MFDFNLLKKLLFPSWHYFIMGIAGLLVFYTDNFLITKLKGVEYVALYAVTYRISDVCLKAISRITSTKYPKILALSAVKDYSGILKLHNRLLFLNLSIVLPVSLLLFFFGKDLLILWLGHKFQYDNSIIRLFAVFTVFMVCAQNTGWFISGLGIHKRFAYMGLMEGVLNFVLSITLFSYFDLFGIALGTLIAHIATNGWFAYYEFYTFVLPRRSTLIPREP